MESSWEVEFRVSRPPHHMRDWSLLESTCTLWLSISEGIPDWLCFNRGCSFGILQHHSRSRVGISCALRTTVARSDGNRKCPRRLRMIVGGDQNRCVNSTFFRYSRMLPSIYSSSERSACGNSREGVVDRKGVRPCSVPQPSLQRLNWWRGDAGTKGSDRKHAWSIG